MNKLLDEYTYNFVIDEVVYWPPRAVEVLIASLNKEGCPNLLVKFKDGQLHETKFDNLQSFQSHWVEAEIILEAVTDIKLVNELPESNSLEGNNSLAQEVYQKRERIIDECLDFFRGQEADQKTCNIIIEQFGYNSKNLPDRALEMLAMANE